MSRRVERLANDHVSDEEFFGREPERSRREQRPPQPTQPQWCPKGLTKTKKRKLQRVRKAELEKEEQGRDRVWRPKNQNQNSADINMVFMLPKEFMVPSDQETEGDEEEGAAQLNLDPMAAIFEKPEEQKRQYLKALFLKGLVDGRPITKMLVDGGAAVNIMPYAMFRKLGKGE